MNRKIVFITVIVIFALVISVINPLPSGEIISYHETKTVVTILAGQSTSDAGIEDIIHEVLIKKFPEVQFEWICVDWGASFDAQVNAKYVSGDFPDILIGKAQDVKNYYDNQMLAPLQEECYLQIAKNSLNEVTIEGKVYGIPYTENFQGVLYNKELFNKHGLFIPDTLEDMDSIVKVLEENGMIPFAGHFQESWKVGNLNMQFFMNDIFKINSDWGDRFRDCEYNYSDNQRVEKLFEQNKYILEHSFLDAIQINQYESDLRFAKGEAAMYPTGTWSLQALSQVVPETNVGIFPYPNLTGDSDLLIETNMTFMKGVQTKHSQLVDEILEEVGTNEALSKEIVDYTQSRSTFINLMDNGKLTVMDDINEYQKQDRIINVLEGNTQLIWSFQNDVASKTLLWLQGKRSLSDVLQYADIHREESTSLR